MTTNSLTPPDWPVLSTDGLFIVQLRSDSDLPGHCVRGRIEHVMSGQSEPFDGLEAMLGFMDRHRALGAPGHAAEPSLEKNKQ